MFKMSNLVIVESPAKARTISKYLGPGYKVYASMGHVKDLPEKNLGVDIEDNFKPKYVIIPSRRKLLLELKKLSEGTEKIFLALDPDREGEAIAYHLAVELNKKKKTILRPTFHEITPHAIKEAIFHPGQINEKKVDAQQTRRILDRLVGYMISPILCRRVSKGLSAGRVQSVAVRLICEREREIELFVTEEYWSITANLSKENNETFFAKLEQINEKKIKITNQEQAEGLCKEIERNPFIVKEIVKKEKKQYPFPPFITSTLQQEGVRKLNFSAKKTMMVAQQLYEGLDVGEQLAVGLITYMRTDSVDVSVEAQKITRDFIANEFGKGYLPLHPPIYKSKKTAQEAHESIHPTDITRTPDKIKNFLSPDQYKLYRLIWQRFVASQMNPAILDITRVDIAAGEFLFRATGKVVKFDGFMRIYIEGKDEADDEDGKLPQLKLGELLNLLALEPKQHFTQPPPRYSEATLVKTLEEKGIGRPSTYATIISTIQDRNYVCQKEKKFHPTDLGNLVNEILIRSFPTILDVSFTAQMEDKLDEIEDGNAKWQNVLQDFYTPFSIALKDAENKIMDVKKEKTQPTDIICKLCGLNMVIRMGKNGKFLGCSGYPKCKHTMQLTEEGDGEKSKDVPEETSEICPKCSSPLIIRKSKYGRFISCKGYPQCKFTKPLGTGISCPEGCGGELSQRRTKKGSYFYGCNNYPDCTFILWDEPTKEVCPKCNGLLVKRKNGNVTRVVCIRLACGYEQQ